MYLFENPVLQRELLTNLRMNRAFVLLLVYQAVLGAVVFMAWPQQERLQANAEEARTLVDLFFVGQYILASLMAPSFAAGTITGEKERKTYEMLLASPLRPAAIVLGKLLASLTHLAILIFASLPIVLLCLPLGGVSPYEVFAAYLGLILSVVLFGMISVACSSFFQRTASSLVVSYLLILPLAIFAVLMWQALANEGDVRFWLAVTALPGAASVIFIAMFANTTRRLLHPPDVGSEGNEVVDLEKEAEEVVGLVIQRDQFPDRLFAPPKRADLLPDNANPVYDKELHSEIFAQGTLMLRLVIQVSMFLAIPIMAVCLFMLPVHAPWYMAYVITFNMLVGPVFSAGSITSERERQTLDLLLTTTITPWQILWGKLVTGLRVSSVLTAFLVWPVVLACAMVPYYWRNLLSVAVYLGILVLTCLTTAITALFCSVVFRKTSMSIMTTYLIMIVLFCAPLSILFFTQTFVAPQGAERDALETVKSTMAQGQSLDEAVIALNAVANTSERRSSWNVDHMQSLLVRERSVRRVSALSLTSPYAAAFSVPLRKESRSRRGEATPSSDDSKSRRGNWTLVGLYTVFALVWNGTLFYLMIWLFNSRWRVSQ